MMRLDKFLHEMGFGSRSEVKKLIKLGIISVNDVIIKSDKFQIDENTDVVKVDDVKVDYVSDIYLMFNKPAGCVTAVKDNHQECVMDYITEYNGRDLFPVGRLDIDTEGLLLITNDGVLCHKLLAPKNHVPKIYYVETSDKLNNEQLEMIENCVLLDDGPVCNSLIEESGSGYLLTIHEGRFHQVKRMMIAVGTSVTYLKRVSFGSLELDENLALGEYRSLTKEEIEILKNNKKQ